MSILKRLRQNRNEIFEKTKKASEKKEWKSEFYYPNVDKNTGSGSSIIRFLPSADPDEVPYVQRYEHFFQGCDRNWHNFICPTSWGADYCPCCDRNSSLWKTNDEKLQNIVRKRKRKQNYIANILVIKDPATPENEGKVFPFKFGFSIFNKIAEAMNPPKTEIDDDEIVSFNPFDLWEGANFKFVIFRDPNKDNQVSYERCGWSKQSELFDGDEAKLEKILEQCTDLKKYVDPKLLPADIEAKMKAAYKDVLDEPEEKFSPPVKQKELPKKVVEKNKEEDPFTEEYVEPTEDDLPFGDSSETEDNDESDIDYFKKLVAED